MARIWCVGMLLALTAAAGLGRWTQTAEAILMAGSQAVRLGVTLTGSMMLWGGLMEMLHDTAVLGWVSGGVRRLLKPLVRRELSEESWAASTIASIAFLAEFIAAAAGACTAAKSGIPTTNIAAPSGNATLGSSKEPAAKRRT